MADHRAMVSHALFHLYPVFPPRIIWSCWWNNTWWPWQLKSVHILGFIRTYERATRPNLNPSGPVSRWFYLFLAMQLRNLWVIGHFKCVSWCSNTVQIQHKVLNLPVQVSMMPFWATTLIYNAVNAGSDAIGCSHFATLRLRKVLQGRLGWGLGLQGHWASFGQMNPFASETALFMLFFLLCSCIVFLLVLVALVGWPFLTWLWLFIITFWIITLYSWPPPCTLVKISRQPVDQIV